MRRVFTSLAAIYLLFGALAFGLSWLGIQQSPLGGIWMALVAVPWSLFLPPLSDNGFINLAVLGLCILLNAAILYGIGRLFGRREA